MKTKLMWSVVGAVMIGAVGAYGVSLPHMESFASGSGDWASGVGATHVPGAVGAPGDMDGHMSLEHEDGSTLTLTVDGDPTDVWAFFYARPAVYVAEPSESMAGVAAALCFVDLEDAGSAKLYVNNGGTWGEPATPYAGLAMSGDKTADWVGLAVHLDYGANEWDVYKVSTGEAFDAHLTRLNTGGALAFADTTTPPANLETIAISSELQGDIDAPGVAVGSSAIFADQYDEVVVRVLQHDPNVRHAFNVRRNTYTGGGERELSGIIGDHLATGLRNGDDLGVITGPGTFAWYNYDGTGWDANPTLAEGEDVLLSYVASNPDQLLFYPEILQPIAYYDSPPASSGVAGLSWPIAAGGWTHVRFDSGDNPAPMTLSATTLADDLDDDTGDEVWIDANGDGAYLRHTLDATGFRSRATGNYANGLLINNNSGFWINNAGGAETWDLP